MAFARHILIWLLLVLLLGLNIAVAFSGLGHAKPWINLAVAVVQAAIVYVFLMKIGEFDSTTRIAAAAAFGWFLLLVAIPLIELTGTPR